MISEAQNKNRILVVEDEGIVARDIWHQLTLLNYDPVAETSTGEEALVLAAKLKPDLVLMDIQLAGDMDGIAAAHAIRHQYDIPVVFLTALVRDANLERAKLSEPFGYITKPFDERDLRTVIEMALYKHQTDKALRDANRMLREKDAQRERAAQELARKNQELENVLYAASHDLRSPMLNIQGFGKRLELTCGELTGLMEQAELPPQQRQQAQALVRDQIPKALRFIQASVEKMDVLIGGLLRLSRVGQVEMRRDTLDMDQLVKQIVTAMTFQIQSAEAGVEIEPLPACEGDPMLVSQVFSNLLDNAIKYRDSGRPLRIRVSGWHGGDDAVYCVADNGIGIAPEERDKIWELFRRLNPSGAEAGEGLGLNLVSRIVERHGGRVWVESTPGQGSRFFVALRIPGADRDPKGTAP